MFKQNRNLQSAHTADNVYIGCYVRLHLDLFHYIIFQYFLRPGSNKIENITKKKKYLYTYI